MAPVSESGTLQKSTRNIATGAVLPLGVAFALVGGGGIAQAAGVPTAEENLQLRLPAHEMPLLETAACGDITEADESAASALNGELSGDMAGQVTGYHASCARAVVEAAQERGMGRHAATIAITTVIVETHLNNYTGGDRDSVGLYQQRDHYGSPEQRLDPAWATNAFYDEMERVYPNGSWADHAIGDVCQGVQRSAYPDRYQHQAGDAETIVNHLW